VIRGALTNGHDWIFLFLDVNLDGSGSFVESKSISLMSYDSVLEKASSVISGLVAHWVSRFPRWMFIH